MALFNFQPIVDTVSGAFDWLKDNPEVASAIGGAASAGIQYLQYRDQKKAREQERAEDRAYRATFGGPSSLGQNDYGANLNIAQQGIAPASPVGTHGPQNVGTVGAPQQTMSSALANRANRQLY